VYILVSMQMGRSLWVETVVFKGSILSFVNLPDSRGDGWRFGISVSV